MTKKRKVLGKLNYYNGGEKSLLKISANLYNLVNLRSDFLTIPMVKGEKNELER